MSTDEFDYGDLIQQINDLSKKIHKKEKPMPSFIPVHRVCECDEPDVRFIHPLCPPKAEQLWGICERCHWPALMEKANGTG